MKRFDKFFKQATGHEGPFDYQRRLALEEELPQLLDVPTGAGKTAGVVLAWLWRRRFADEATRKATPRRLVYCLPMRVLVEQTRDNCVNWLHRLGLLGGAAFVQTKEGKEVVVDWEHPDKIAVTVLMGGEDRDDWDIYPERDAVIIGTQDMLLSRALNRGYGMSRYRWPMHFGLLNNDCLWVMDEVQLMGVGVETSAQMHAFREMMGTQGNNYTIWMSATLGEKQLETVDHPKPTGGWSACLLGRSDYSIPILQKRYNTKKPIAKESIHLDKEDIKNSYAENVAQLVLSKHKPGTLTLCVVNNVSRSQEIFQKLLDNGRSEKNTAVLHSHFREGDRAARMTILTQEGDRVIVSTPVVEAGVDISAHTLITELAPWPSLVQRFGRCNRYGEYGDALIEWIDITLENEKDKLMLPYDAETLEMARRILTEPRLTDVGPKTLADISYEPPAVIRPVIRRKDILDLFDTTPDLTGNDLDVSRYIRDGDDKDVQVYWRGFPEDAPSGKLGSPQREELCSVSIGEINRYLRKNTGWIWDHLDARWRSVGKGGEINDCMPGQVLLLDPENGGYDNIMGWIGPIGKKGKPVDVIQFEKCPTCGKIVDQGNEPFMDEDEESYGGNWVLLNVHILDVAKEVRNLSNELALSGQYQNALKNAAEWHDVGKAHEAFQNMLSSSGQPPKKSKLWGKSDYMAGECPTCKRIKNYQRPSYWVNDGHDSKIKRPYFRHELASALAWLQHDGQDCPHGNLVAYLVAAHHGKVRLSIRSLPQEKKPTNDEDLFARGIWQGDTLPPVPPILSTPTPMDLSLMLLGGGSWLNRMIHLRDDKELGPFRLSFLETVLRVADWRASK